MTYLRARYYDSTIRRFITEDPAKDGNNWYAYCGNNPVMCVDPSGMKVYIPNNQEAVLENLHCLSRDTYGIDSNGYLFIKDQGMDGTVKGVGTELICQLIQNDNTCTITFDNNNTMSPDSDDLSESDGVGSNATVTFNSDYNKQKEVGVKDDSGNVTDERMPTYIALGHELIHALRAMKGHRKVTGVGTNVMKNSNGMTTWQEELDTCGIDHMREDGTYADANKWYFTENSLRREHGLKERVNYGK